MITFCGCFEHLIGDMLEDIAVELGEEALISLLLRVVARFFFVLKGKE